MSGEPAPILQKVKDRLSAVDGIGSRVYPAGQLPQDPTYPAMTYQVIAAPPAAALTQLARFTDYRIQVSIFDRDSTNVARLRSLVLVAIEAMPEHVTREADLEGPFAPEPKVFEWMLDFQFRDAEAAA